MFVIERVIILNLPGSTHVGDSNHSLRCLWNNFSNSHNVISLCNCMNRLKFFSAGIIEDVNRRSSVKVMFMTLKILYRKTEQFSYNSR